MALPNITFFKGQGGLGRALPGQDHYSGLLYYSSVLPSGFTTSNRIRKFLSVGDAENAGIKADYSDETKATATYTVSAAGANGDTINFTVNEVASGKSVNLGTFTKTSTYTTTANVAVGIAQAISQNSSVHGYLASVTGSVVTIVARPGLGISLNTGTQLVSTSVGAINGTLVSFSGGTFSRNAIYHYHISEFFRIQKGGVLWVGIFAIPGTYTFSEIVSVVNFSIGSIRQIGIWKDSAAFSTADITAIDIVNKSLDDLKKPLVAIYAADLTATTDISTLTDMNVLSANTVEAQIGQDGGGLGAYLYAISGKSITMLGASLGAWALAKVNESKGWVAKFNLSNGTELETLAFANGKLYSDPSVTDNLLDLLDTYRYVFGRKFVGQSGSYFNQSNMAVSVSSDYAYGEDNRTIQKAERLIYASLLLSLNGPLTLNADGTLANTTVAALETAANIDQMIRDAEISAYSATVDPQQNVLTTGIIIVSVLIVQQGVARQINVPIAYTTSIV